MRITAATWAASFSIHCTASPRARAAHLIRPEWGLARPKSWYTQKALPTTGFAFATQDHTDPVFVLRHLIEEPAGDVALSLENLTPLKHDREAPDELSPRSGPAFTAWFWADMPGVTGGARELLAAVAVDVGQVIRAVDPQLIGVNATWWDTNLNTSQTQQMVEAAGLNLFRLPGGSSSDDFHFNAAPTYQGEGTIPSMASFVASVNGQAVVTLDYGSGSPQEAAAELAYLNAPVGATTPIGDGQEWNDATGQWQTVNWQNAGYWASLRAATPLAVDDGLNFLRLGRTAPFGFHYFEVGNEEYGSWEIDHHTVPHDPATYVAFAKQFQTFAAAIDPSISIGIDAGSPRQLVQQLGSRRPPAIGRAGLHDRFHQRPQLRPGPGQ